MKGRIVFSVIAICCCGLLIWLVKPARPEQPKEPCSSDAYPCIKLVNAKGGEVARFNDFRFTPDHCLIYKQLYTQQWIKYCNGTMKWIGPETTPAGAANG